MIFMGVEPLLITLTGEGKEPMIDSMRGDYPELMGRWKWPHFKKFYEYMPAYQAARYARRRIHGEEMGSWLTNLFSKGQASGLSVQTAQGGVALSPTGVNISMPQKGGAGLPGGAGGGIMEFVKSNPLMVAAGVGGIALLFLMRKKK